MIIKQHNKAELIPAEIFHFQRSQSSFHPEFVLIWFCSSVSAEHDVLLLHISSVCKVTYIWFSTTENWYNFSHGVSLRSPYLWDWTILVRYQLKSLRTSIYKDIEISLIVLESQAHKRWGKKNKKCFFLFFNNLLMQPHWDPYISGPEQVWALKMKILKQIFVKNHNLKEC